MLKVGDIVVPSELTMHNLDLGYFRSTSALSFELAEIVKVHGTGEHMQVCYYTVVLPAPKAGMPEWLHPVHFIKVGEVK
jgi:hypothetical protein